MDTDLTIYARDAASRGDDLYALLGVDALASESDIRRAFRRKALTAHPDKAGDAYDASYYERLERARDVLLAADARRAYDDGMRAAHEKRQRLSEMDARRRRLVEDLEAREREAKRVRMGEGQATHKRDPEREAMVARGRKKMEERQRLMREAEERERLARGEGGEGGKAETKLMEEDRLDERPDETGKDAGRAPSPPTGEAAAEPKGGDDYDDRIAELERRIKEKQQRKAEKKAKKRGAAPAKEPSSPHDPPSTHAAEADALQQPSETASEQASSSAFIPHRPSAQASADAGGGKFAATMARLKAAQAEKRRRKAEEEAARAVAEAAEVSARVAEA